MMKTLIFNGSPRKNGNTEMLIEELTKHLEGEVRIVSSYFDDISPCIDCRYCWENKGCTIKDDMQEVYEYLETCDNFILASPIWFSSLSGPLINLASRLQPYFAAKHFRKEQTGIKRKNGVLVIAGAEAGTEKRAVTTANIIMKLVNASPSVASIFALDTDSVSVSDDTEILGKARDTACMLNELYKEQQGSESSD